jgi:hypothetical protein
MKKIIPLFSLVIIMLACNTAPKPEVLQAAAVNPDTSGFGKFQEWKMQNELADAEEYKLAQLSALSPQKISPKIKATPVRKSNTASKKSSGNAGSGTSDNNSGGSISDNSEQTAKAPAKKEGWSKAAKGAAIGGAGGAVTGAVLNKKNRVMGAIIGGVLGAGGGYVIGRKMDKKDSRIDN